MEQLLRRPAPKQRKSGPIGPLRGPPGGGQDPASKINIWCVPLVFVFRWVPNDQDVGPLFLLYSMTHHARLDRMPECAGMLHCTTQCFSDKCVDRYGKKISREEKELR